MQKILLILFIFLGSQLRAQNYCDSIEISMNLPSNSFPEFSVNLSNIGASGTTYDWELLDESGGLVNSSVAAIAIFPLPNNLNSDTNIICLLSTFSISGMTFACNTCDTIVWDGASWVLLSMIPPICNLTGGSVYIDHSMTPIMMNAAVNGMSQYTYIWSDGSTANQKQYYENWCVTITDIISGCDTTICENCVAIPNPNCICPFIYMPVCGCDGVQYDNYCMAECVQVGWIPAISNGMPGGFLPCNQPSSCIDSSLIDLNTICIEVWDPVCGCDSVTYGNSCEAENWYGVTSWTQGPCNATGILDVMSAQVIIYPNPASGIVNISLPKSEVFNLELYDIMGRLVFSENKVLQKYIISDKFLEDGIYALKLYHSKGVITKKIIFK